MKNWLFFTFLVCVAGLCMPPQMLQGQTITTIAGCGIGDDSIATRAELDRPAAVALDHLGNTYIADYDNGLVRKVNAAGIISTIATGNGPQGVAVDKAGNIYVAFSGFNVVRKISPTGGISNVAGTGTAGYNGDVIPATSAKLNAPADVAVDTAGNIYIADEDNYRVRKVDPSGTITTVAGNGVYGSPTMGGLASGTSISHPYRVALDKTGNLFIGDVGTYQVYKVDTADTITSFMGTGTYGFTGDGGPATAARMSYADGLVTDTAGNLYVSDRNNCRIRVVNAATGIVNTLYGTGTGGYSGDGGPATAAQLNTPQGLAFDSSGNLFISDYHSNRIREVNTSGVISTFAGQSGFFGEGYPATNAELSFIINLTTDAAGNIYTADVDNHRVRMINPVTGAITTVAGCGISGQQDNFSGDGGPATAAHLYFPNTLAFDQAGNMYICDQSNQRVRIVNTSGIINTFAGNGTYGFVDNVPAANAEFRNPTGVVADKTGNVYICDNANHRIRKVDITGMVTTVAGTGTAGYSGDGGPAISAQLNYPYDVALDGSGNLYISDGSNYCIRKVDSMGNISTVAGNGTLGFSGDDGPAVDAQMRAAWGIKVDSAGNIFIADDDNQRIRLVTTDGIIITIAGEGTAGFFGDGGPALAAHLAYPKGVAFDKAGNFYIADNSNRRIRKTSLPPGLAVPRVNKPSIGNVFTYPNPTVGIVTIMNAANCDAVVYDVLGRQVLQAAITNNRETLDLSNLAGGVYELQVTNKNADRKVLKITKE